MIGLAMAQPEYIESNGFIAEVIRTNRSKSADVRVEDGAVSIVVPKGLDSHRIIQILDGKLQWIKNKIHLHREAIPVSSKDYVSGESFPYLGRNYRLKVEEGEYVPVKLINGRLCITVPDRNNSECIRSSLIHWYRKNAHLKLTNKVNRYQQHIDKSAKSIHIKTFKARWGSCSSNDQISFNWKVMMTPNAVCNYVVVHEICHMIHHNHSQHFWKEVEKLMPDYETHKQWLKDNSHQLEL